MNYWLILITGLTIGGVSCMAVQGGLLASLLSTINVDNQSGAKRQTALVTGVFLLSKFVAYTILGGVLGLLSQSLKFSEQVQTWLQLASGIYMLLVAGNLLELHPLLRYTIPQPPKAFGRLLRSQSRSHQLFAPALLGLATILIPCGTTLAMETLAISSGSMVSGALVMGIYTIATFPTFVGIGALVALTSQFITTYFTRIAALAICALALISINGSLVLLNSPITLQTISGGVISVFSVKQELQTAPSIVSGETQTAEILITPRGYSPSNIVVHKNVPLTLTIKSQNVFSCATAFRIPSLHIGKDLAPTDVQTITFTPEKSGSIPFACSMGMYSGTITVI